MRTLKLIAITLLALTHHETRGELTGCESKLYNKYSFLDKSQYRLPARTPDFELQERMTEFEILCPWQLEQDFNGDHQKDWLGIVVKNHQHYLLAYLSMPGSHRLSIVKSYKSFPRETHLELMTTQEAQLITQKKLNQPPKYVFIENKMGSPATIYIWQVNQFVQLGQFEGNY